MGREEREQAEGGRDEHRHVIGAGELRAAVVARVVDAHAVAEGGARDEEALRNVDHEGEEERCEVGVGWDLAWCGGGGGGGGGGGDGGGGSLLLLLG